MTEEGRHLENAVSNVTTMLKAKEAIWTAATDRTFDNFDIHQDAGTHPIQFGINMCALKLNRLKSRLRSYTQTGVINDNLSATAVDWKGFASDPDTEECVADMASYALLLYGLILREKRGRVYESKKA